MIEPKEKINVGTRLASILLDHFFMCFAMMILCIPVMVNSGIFTNEKSDPLDSNFGITMGLGFSLYFLKDIIKGRSMAKRILNLQVVDNTTGVVASPIKCVIRNFLVPLWMIEVLVTIGNPNRRLGDKLANTKVVPFDEGIVVPNFSIKDYLLPIFLSLIFVLILQMTFSFVMS